MADIDETLNSSETTSTEEYQYQPTEDALITDAEEYKGDALSDDIDLSNLDEGRPATKSRFKKILFPVILVLAILLVYQILSWYSKGKQKLTEQPKTPPVPAITIPQPQPQKVEAPAQIAPIAPVAAETPQLDEKFTELKKQTQQNNQRLAAIEDSVNQAQMNIAGLDRSISNLSASINVLNKNLSGYLANIKRSRMARRKARLPRKISYHVKAVVPGRAWLEAPNGKTISVRVGDKVNDGVVQLISPEKGLVLTSTGEMIQYGSNDI